jgi:hypothetical protein
MKKGVAMDTSIREEALKLYRLLSMDVPSDENGRSHRSGRTASRNSKRASKSRITKKNKGRIRRRKP